MAETEAMIGYGSRFELHDGEDPGTFAAIAEVFNLSPPSDNMDVVDGTHMQSPDATREFVLGLRDPGEASFEINFVPGGSGDDAIQAWRDARERRQCRITFPNGAVWAFSGLLTGYEPDAPTDDRMTASVTVKVTSSYAATEPATPVNEGLPTISGTAQVNQTLTANEGQWFGAVNFSYQWQQNGGSWANISGATGKTYVPVVGNIGNPLRVRVTASNSAGSAQATSDATANVIAA